MNNVIEHRVKRHFGIDENDLPIRNACKTSAVKRLDLRFSDEEQTELRVKKLVQSIQLREKAEIRRSRSSCSRLSRR